MFGFALVSISDCRDFGLLALTLCSGCLCLFSDHLISLWIRSISSAVMGRNWTLQPFDPAPFEPASL